ncbi:MAG: glutamate--tRNA ligase family protein [Patescibacteria group bacterium]
MNVRVRFPPSPTGYCHVGTARMAILNYLFARKQGGKIIFRSEDTDKERSKREFEADIMESITWLGLSWDEFYRQSERTAVYRAALERLIGEGKAYVSEEESKKEPGVMVKPVRLKNAGKKITFTDLIRGGITFDTTELKDFVIARSIDDPLYHLAVVVDDADMDITHVIRGEDHISNTPRQILIQEALGLPRPAYAHYPLHLSAERSKLSKRTGDVAVRSYREKGYLPEALLNYLSVLGWTPPSGNEILSLEEMITEFELRDIHKSGAVFDIEKLNWFNHSYLARLSIGEYEQRLVEFAGAKGSKLPDIERISHDLQQRGRTLEEALQLYEDEYKGLQSAPRYDVALLLRGAKVDAGTVKKHLQFTSTALGAVPDDMEFSAERVKKEIFDYATEHGRGSVLWPLRVALTGREKSPDPFTVAGYLGKEETLRRINNAIGMV